MKVCKSGETGSHVKIMQAFLKHRGFVNDKGVPLTVDGSFGPSSLQALKSFQKTIFNESDNVSVYNEYWDGICDYGTWAKLAYYVPSTINPNLWVQKIPIANITKFDMHITNAITTKLADHNTKNGDFMTMNAVFFSNGNPATDKYYYWNLVDLVINGIIQKYGGNYSNIGIAVDKKLTPMHFYRATTPDVVNKPGVDFVAGTPPIVQNGVINIDSKGLGSSFVSPKNLDYRWGYGFTKDGYFVKITTALNTKASVQDLGKEAIAQGCDTFINCDGGGSVAEVINGTYMYTQSRPVTTALGINLKF